MINSGAVVGSDDSLLFVDTTSTEARNHALFVSVAPVWCQPFPLTLHFGTRTAEIHHRLVRRFPRRTQSRFASARRLNRELDTKPCYTRTPN